MPLLTRLTHELASRLADPQRYVTRLPGLAPERPAVYLTFDDGPHPDRTNRILDSFAEFGGHGTFFVIGRQARRFPRTLCRLLDEGHSVGCHTWSHRSARNCSTADYIKDVHQSRDIIEQITGRPIDLFRPPYGELTPLTLYRLLNDGYRIVHWSRDTRDFELPPIADLPRRFDRQPLTDGDIVLMHDNCSVTSYSLETCLRRWGRHAAFRGVPMANDSHDLRVPEVAATAASTAGNTVALAGSPGSSATKWESA